MRTWNTHSNLPNYPKILEFGYEDIPTNGKWGPGKRNFYILHYVLEGKGFFNGVSIGEGEGFLITPMQSAEYHPSPACPWKYFWICFEDNNGKRLCDEYLTTDENGIFQYNFKIVLNQILDELQSIDCGLGNMYALSVFYKILSNHEQCKTQTNHFVEKAICYMHTNYHKAISITQVADFCGINDRYLYNLFMRHLGISPKYYLNDLRLKNAIRILKNCNCPITEVAYSVGFNDVLTFSRFFSKNTGVSPSAYRKNISINNSDNFT